jgi:hypothetical protein
MNLRAAIALLAFFLFGLTVGLIIGLNPVVPVGDQVRVR